MSAPPSDRALASERLTVPLGGRAYDILIGAGSLRDTGAALVRLRGDKLKRGRVAIVTDSNIANAGHLDTLTRSLDAAGIPHRTEILEPGEDSKSFARFHDLCESLLRHGLERGSLILALGGGVIGDLAGFAASVLLRGIDYVQIPTTLLSQVDSSVGGKTAINSAHGKNLIGAFHQPALVIADTDTLNTLPNREMLAGYAEVVKYGLIRDAAFFTWLERNGADLVAGDADRQRHAIRESCAAKADVVAEDERETGARALLNFGHTFGHALEAECGYGAILHGEAVAIGMRLAFDISAELGFCGMEEAKRVRTHLESVGLSTAIPQAARNPERLLDHMGRDKKVAEGRITFILTRGIGKAFVTRDVAPERVAAFLDRAAV